ncbi:flagellar biosynthetic protein FliO [Desulfovibrio oxyclinae]|jgi:flagellar protein FliO/FliZ|uniref:flagellar biosynthetic protein FliO n=1 Tax=Desulfovibrio oxyclinae TaxID=63560 RepID=UPI00036C901B|nr:flagellar biosynthetic protein FliO [Desulfovibrio oxyclinae]
MGSAANATAAVANGTAAQGPVFDTGLSVLSTLGWLSFVLLLIYAAYWLVKRFAPAGIGTGGRGDLKVEERVMLGNHQTVCVVRYGKRRFLVGATAQHINMLADLDRKNLSDFEEALAESVSEDD